ncbi:T9SS type A sorting domain-containing protein [Jiulongibacter sediminis]|uniref:T9SS type A sorting domain-containing protein n=1 Tax=Jiulongibacter sediminis TaxID=1605367 RepID=UPI0026EF49F0|nr:T9SS type A sorting domain-containing protein [Jiulongibacter sediminis]
MSFFRSSKIILIIISAFLISQISKAQVNYENDLVVKCSVPVYGVTGKDVTGDGRNDGEIKISGIINATHYEILKDNRNFDFEMASPLDSGQTRVTISGLGNPDANTIYNIRLYNNGEDCYTDQSIHLSHINYTRQLEYTELQVIQGVDNPSPQIGDIVTFTTVLQNTSNQAATNVQVSQFYSQSLEIIYFYADIGTYSPITSSWDVGNVKVGTNPKLVIRARVSKNGLSYLTSFISKANGENLKYGQTISTQDSSLPTAQTSCVTVPIEIKKDEVYKVTLQDYRGLTWYYKDAAGNFSEINEFTNPAIAEINPDSSLSIKQSGEFTYTKQTATCTYNACCPIIVQGCKGPPIIVDSVYCNTNVDSYNIQVHLVNDNWSLVERVFYALSNLNYPILSNFLRKLNVLPLTSSAGFVTSLGGGNYLVENVPSFMPNVTLVSTDINGDCRNVKIVNAPNCEVGILPQPQLVSTLEFFSPGQMMPNLKVENPQPKVKTYWYADELGEKRIGKGSSFRPSESGTYYVAFVDKRNDRSSQLVKAEVRDIVSEQRGQFVNVQVCDCKNPSMLPGTVDQVVTVARIFPNPVQDNLHVEFEMPSLSKTADIMVFNMSGRLVSVYALEGKTGELNADISSWDDGLYIMTMVVDGQKKLTQRFVKR